MMNKKNVAGIAVALIFVIAIVVSSCNTNDKRYFAGEDTFKMEDLETFKLEGVIMQFNDTIMHPVGIDVKDTLLFLKNRSTEYVYDIYNLNSNEKLNECLTIGQGPDEFIFPLIIQSPDANVRIYDKGKTILKEYVVSDLLDNHYPVSIKTIPLGNHSSDKAVVLSDGNILASINTLPRGGFDLYDSNGIFLDSIGKFPEFTSKNLSDMEKIHSFRNGFTTNMTDRIVTSYLYTDLIEVYDFKGNCIKRMHGPHQIELAMDLRSAGGGYTGAQTIKGKTYKCYSSPVYAGDEVFILYFGELWEDYQERDFKIMVFDWDGNPLRMYELDTHLFTFTVDPEHRIIYGITNSPEYRIIKYNY
ncbi:MAG: TolB-like 6-bladed beta-propeller domain-containing protein [Dysgonamonadaceae bacterium]|jgi:hypothetical protein|nr:TolB-like 6-bladed beta-propeller domain-containing protein [Dysgonamonadaceae bacterium]